MCREVCLPGAMVITRIPLEQIPSNGQCPSTMPLMGRIYACPTWRGGGHRGQGPQQVTRVQPCPYSHTWPSRRSLAVLMMTPRWPPWSGSGSGPSHQPPWDHIEGAHEIHLEDQKRRIGLEAEVAFCGWGHSRSDHFLLLPLENL